MIRGKKLSTLVKRLEERHASVYHACQLRDFRSYLAVGGVPSRRLLERRGLGFTGFVSDQRDKENRVWDKVFLNLQDYGKLFDQGKVAVPNPYGPILIRFAPKALECAANVAVCLRSAGAADFDRKGEALTLEETERIFQSPYNDKIKFPRDLREEFEDEKAQSPELSCRVKGQVLPFVRAGQCLVDEVKVDPCDTGHVQLGEAVRELSREYDLEDRVVVRMGQRGYRAHYRKVVEELRRIRRKHLGEDTDTALCRLAESEDSRTRLWARNVQSKPHITRQFRQFARYLVEGTLGKRNAPST